MNDKAREQIMTGRLRGKTALVTGATSNIGRAEHFGFRDGIGDYLAAIERFGLLTAEERA